MATRTWKGNQPTFGDPHPGDLDFMQAIYEDSTIEMDWLWVATRVTSDSQRRYCLQRALRINPRSRPAKRGLRAAQERSSGAAGRQIAPEPRDWHEETHHTVGALIRKLWSWRQHRAPMRT